MVTNHKIRMQICNVQAKQWFVHCAYGCWFNCLLEMSMFSYMEPTFEIFALICLLFYNRTLTCTCMHTCIGPMQENRMVHHHFWSWFVIKCEPNESDENTNTRLQQIPSTDSRKCHCWPQMCCWPERRKWFYKSLNANINIYTVEYTSNHALETFCS